MNVVNGTIIGEKAAAALYKQNNVLINTETRKRAGNGRYRLGFLPLSSVSFKILITFAFGRLCGIFYLYATLM